MLAFTAGPLMMLTLPVAYVVSYTAFIIDLSLNGCLSLHISALSGLFCCVEADFFAPTSYPDIN